MTTTPKTEATRLAEFKDLEYWPAGVGLTDWVESVCAEMLRLDAALADELNNRDVLDKMLTQCITERDQLRAQVERVQGGEPVTLTDFDAIDDDVIDAAQESSGMYRVELMRAWNAIIAALREKEQAK